MSNSTTKHRGVGVNFFKDTMEQVYSELKSLKKRVHDLEQTCEKLTVSNKKLQSKLNARPKRKPSVTPQPEPPVSLPVDLTDESAIDLALTSNKKTRTQIKSAPKFFGADIKEKLTGHVQSVTRQHIVLSDGDRRLPISAHEFDDKSLLDSIENDMKVTITRYTNGKSSLVVEALH